MTTLRWVTFKVSLQNDRETSAQLESRTPLQAETDEYLHISQIHRPLLIYKNKAEVAFIFE